MLTQSEPLLLGVDGGGTKCRARLSAASGKTLAEAVAGPANIRFGLQTSFAAVFQAGAECLQRAGLSGRDLPRVVACFALCHCVQSGCRSRGAIELHRGGSSIGPAGNKELAACFGGTGGTARK